jgi:hypothetical protein
MTAHTISERNGRHHPVAQEGQDQDEREPDQDVEQRAAGTRFELADGLVG